MSTHPSLTAPAVFDPTTSTGFTAVNGETNAISFRPLADAEMLTYTASSVQPRNRSPGLQTNGVSKHSRVDGIAPTNRESAPVQASSPQNDSPPPKRQRISSDEGRLTPDYESSQTPPSNTSRPERTVIDIRDESRPPREEIPQVGHNDHRSWNPQDIRPETSRNISRALATHMSAEFARTTNPEYGSTVSRPLYMNVDNNDTAATTNSADFSTGSTETRNRRKRGFTHRTKSGCLTCRSRKKKCDEGKPTCLNCAKGGFECGGYGTAVKGVNYRKSLNPLRGRQHIEAKPAEITSPLGGSRGPPGPPWHGPPLGYSPYAQSSHVAAPSQPPPHLSTSYGAQGHDPRDGWQRPPYNNNDAQYIHLQHTKLAHVDYTPIHIPPFQPADPQSRPPPDAFMPLTYRTSTFNDSMGTASSSRRSSHFPPMQEREPSEREKMLLGQPYRHWKDVMLISDRLECKTAVDLYNRALLPSEGLSRDEVANRFTAILDPSKRASRKGDVYSVGRVGRCGERSIVEAPFYCDYGYNLVLGSETVIAPGCYMQDPCEISIGNRCIIGPNVKFYGMTASIDTKSRAGSQGAFLGGAIRVEDDCYIGGDVTILPYRVIGKGAIVGAGSVVTRNVAPFTIVAGNPAKEVRYIGEQTVDRHMRTDIQKENDEMIDEMKRKRYARHPGNEVVRM